MGELDLHEACAWMLTKLEALDEQDRVLVFVGLHVAAQAARLSEVEAAMPGVARLVELLEQLATVYPDECAAAFADAPTLEELRAANETC